MSLRDIFCQDGAVGILQRGFAADKSAQAYIFAGREGVGKHTTAHQWAKLLLCESPTVEQHGRDAFADSCGSCQSCTLFEAGSHPDYAHVYKELLEFTRDGKGKKTPIDLPIAVVREFLIERVALRPSLSARRVFVVSEAERLNVYSQNAMLKVLEEPPHHCTIIMLCTRPERLLPTIKSRCQTIRFGPVDEEHILSRLTEMGLGREPAAFFARLAQGSIGLACQWGRLELAGVHLFDIKKRIVAAVAGLELSDALDLAEQLLGHAREIAAGWAELDTVTSKGDVNRRAQRTLIQILLSALHDAMVLSVSKDRVLIHSDQAGHITELAARFDPEQAGRRIGEGCDMLRWIDANVNERLIFERLLLRLVPSAIMAPAWS